MAPIQIPAGVPTGITSAIQQNFLSADLKDALTSGAQFRADASKDLLPPHIGQTKTYSKLSMFDVDLVPASPTGSITLGEFSTEQFTAKPIPYGKGFRIDGPTAYTFRGDLATKMLGRLWEWSARTTQRLARGKLFHYAAGTAIVRRAATTSDSTLLVNSLAGLNQVLVNGNLVPVSSTNPLAITIVAATTFTANVTGTTPLNANFPDGPGEITLSTTLSANVAAQSYCYSPTQRSTVYRPNNRASSEAIVSTDIPTLTEILNMRSRLRGLGIAPHRETKAYHLHVDETFLPNITRDARWQYATQGMGPIAIFGIQGMFIPQLGIVVFENNDSPAYGRGKETIVGSAGNGGLGGTGTPGSSVSMSDLGLDVVNSSGVQIRRAIMTGADVMTECYIDEELYFSEIGIRKVGNLTSNLSTYAMGGMEFISGAVDGWRINIQPALDDRGISCKFSVSYPFDFVLETDSRADSNTSDVSPLKRAVVCEYAGV